VGNGVIASVVEPLIAYSLVVGGEIIMTEGGASVSSSCGFMESNKKKQQVKY
jgi:hypothetical protein